MSPRPSSRTKPTPRAAGRRAAPAAPAGSERINAELRSDIQRFLDNSAASIRELERLGGLEPIVDDGACSVHAKHHPIPRSVDIHHVWPISWRGPDVAANKVTVCPTGHRNIHRLLKEYLRANGEPPWATRRKFTVMERLYAARGWAEAHA